MNKLKLEDVVLQNGPHDNPEDGMCVMEAVAYFNNEPHSDHPECACPILTSFMITVNDNMKEDERQLLKPYIAKLVGTRDGNSAKRLEILVHMSVAEVTPHTLRLTKSPELILHAEKLEVLKLGDYTAARSAAWSAAESAAESAAWSERKVIWDMVLKALDRCLEVK